MSYQPTAPDSLLESVRLRRIGPGDEEFLFQVYASTRQEELSVVDWPPAEKEGFLRMQFEAQHRHYQASFAGGDFQIVLRDGQPIGRLYVYRGRDEIRLVDVALLPEHRNAGIGSALVQELLAESSRVGKTVTIHVEKFNPALRLYEKLGFKPIADRGVYWFLEWRAEGQRPAVPAQTETTGG